MAMPSRKAKAAMSSVLAKEPSDPRCIRRQIATELTERACAIRDNPALFIFAANLNTIKGKKKCFIIVPLKQFSLFFWSEKPKDSFF